ncbi:MAG: MarR family transcriptional regulator [Betaproteobacteria bacterium]|nr:MAG: MarR family transcriptional regulator [Betaproteobacteria bacterium]
MSATPSGVNAKALQKLYSRPGFLLRRGHQIAVSIFMQECEKTGLTPPQHGVLIAAGQHPGLSQSDVARLLGFDRATIGQVVKGLEARGLLRRGSSHDNRRNKALVLTPQGAAVLRRAALAMHRISTRLLSPFNAKERKLFMALLSRLTARLNTESRTPLRGVEKR